MSTTSVPIDTFSDEQIDNAIGEYLRDHWEDVLADLETLIAIPSFREDHKAQPE